MLERVSRTSTCYKEVVEDYATFLNLQEGIGSTDYRCDYSIVDGNYFVPILIHLHFIRYGASLDRLKALLSTLAGKVDLSNKGLTSGELFVLLMQKIITVGAPFTS